MIEFIVIAAIISYIIRCANEARNEDCEFKPWKARQDAWRAGQEARFGAQWREAEERKRQEYKAKRLMIEARLAAQAAERFL